MTSDVVIIGAGILGTSVADRLAAARPHLKIVVIEQAGAPAFHTSGRNTGVIHRPFYLDPKTKQTLARCAQESYFFWQDYAAKKGLPWQKLGTIEVALADRQLERLHWYKRWSLQNGMAEDEIQILSADEVRELEPQIRCRGALLCTTDTAVDFAGFTRALKDDAAGKGVEFIFDTIVRNIRQCTDGIEIVSSDERVWQTKFLINCAGGNALSIAHLMGVAREYADMNFRGEYWLVTGDSAHLATHNIYSVPRHSAFPFLDPHYIIRNDGRVEIGPSAVPVFSPYSYRGIGPIMSKIMTRPMGNKLRLLTNPEFITLCAQEWKSSLFKSVMVERVQEFLPTFRLEDCTQRGNAGVRAALIDRAGRFVPEVVEASDQRSFHILNYNSPGATGAPAYARQVVQKLLRETTLAVV